MLIVEDDPTTREMLRRTMNKEGWMVLEAAKWRLGLERLAQKNPNLILLDLMMPEMDGFDFMEAAPQLVGRIAAMCLSSFLRPEI